MSEDGSPFVVRRTVGAGDLPARKSPFHQLTLELTERCDNACVHCYINLPADDADALSREMSTSRVKSILDEAAALGTWAVRFTGGEPLLRADFDDIYLHARKLGLRVLLATNARGITPERADLFVRVPPLEAISVTVYGMRKETYEGISRVQGSWLEFRRGVDLLLERRIPFIVRAVLLPSFEKDREAFEEWARSIPSMNGQVPLYTTEFDLRARRDDEDASQRIRQLRSVGADVPNPYVERPAHAKEGAAAYERVLGPRGEALFRCGAGRKCAVDAYGTLQPCVQLRHPDVCVDLGTSSLEEAGARMRDRLASLTAGNSGYLDRCANCFLRNICEQCPAKSWMESGTLDTPVDYHCRIAHKEAERLGLLDEGEYSWMVSDWKSRLSRLGDGSVLNGLEAGATAGRTAKGDENGRREEVGEAGTGDAGAGEARGGGPPPVQEGLPERGAR